MKSAAEAKMENEALQKEAAVEHYVHLATKEVIFSVMQATGASLTKILALVAEEIAVCACLFYTAETVGALIKDLQKTMDQVHEQISQLTPEERLKTREAVQTLLKEFVEAKRKLH